jgi:hypothetical protein
MTRGFGGRIHPRHVRSIHSSSQNDHRGSQLQRPLQSSQSSGHQQSSFRLPAPRGRGGRSFGGRYGINPGKSIACSVVNTRVTLQERAKLLFRSKRRLLKQKLDRTSRSRFYTLLRATLLTYQNMWATNLQLLLLRQAIHKLLASACTTTTFATCSYSKPAARRAPTPSTTT